MSKKSTKEIEAMIRGDGDTMSRGADTKILSQAREVYAERGIRMDAGASDTAKSAADVAVPVSTKIGKRRKMQTYLLSGAIAAVLIAGVVLGVWAGILRRGQKVPSGDPTPTSYPVGKAWEPGDVYLPTQAYRGDVSGMQLFEGGQTDESSLWVTRLTYGNGLRKEDSEDLYRAVNGMATVSYPFIGAAYQGEQFGHYYYTYRVDQNDESINLVEVVDSKPATVSCFLGRNESLLWDDIRAVRDVNLRIEQKGLGQGRYDSCEQAVLPVEITPDGMYEAVNARLYVALFYNDNGYYKQYMVVWKGKAVQVSVSDRGPTFGWCDLNGDGEPELVTFGQGTTSGVYSFIVYVYSAESDSVKETAVSGKLKEIAATEFTCYLPVVKLAAGENGEIYVKGNEVDARVELRDGTVALIGANEDKQDATPTSSPAATATPVVQEPEEEIIILSGSTETELSALPLFDDKGTPIATSYGYLVRYDSGLDEKAWKSYTKRLDQLGYTEYAGGQGFAHYFVRDDSVIAVDKGSNVCYFHYYTGHKTPVGGYTPEQAADLLRHEETRFILKDSPLRRHINGNPSGVEQLATGAIVMLDITPERLFGMLHAQLFLGIVPALGEMRPALFVTWKGCVFEIQEVAAWSDLNSDGKYELCLLGPGGYSGRSSWRLYVYTADTGTAGEESGPQARLVADTMYADYAAPVTLVVGRDEKLHVRSFGDGSNEVDARIALSETEPGQIELYDELGKLPLKAFSEREK